MSTTLIQNIQKEVNTELKQKYINETPNSINKLQDFKTQLTFTEDNFSIQKEKDISLSRSSSEENIGLSHSSSDENLSNKNPKKYSHEKNDEIGDCLYQDLVSVYTNLSIHRKETTRIMNSVKKCLQKLEKQNNHQKKNKKKGGLMTPVAVSKMLCDFMSIPSESTVSRAQVTQYLHKYIKDNNLYDETNKQFIITNESLSELFDTKKGEKVHIFNMQQKMNNHFKYSNLK